MSDEAEPQGPGRPSLYSDQLAQEIVERLANGEPLAVICRDEHMPCDDTVRNWAAGDEAFSRAIARAREAGFDVIAWRSRLTLRGKIEEEGGESTGDVQRDKAIAEHDLKLLAKWDPRRYGERQKVEHTGEDGGPIQYANMTREQRQARIAELEARRAERSGGA